MIKKKYKILIFLSYFFSNILYANFENSIVVKIDNQIITNFEIKNKILSTLILSDREINQNNINTLKKTSLESLIQSKLKYIETSKFNVTVNDLQINQYLNSISSNDLQYLKNRFLNHNLDFDLYKKEIETEFKWQKLIYQIYSDKINIDTQQIDNELKNIINKNKSIQEFNLSEIEVLVNENEQFEENINNIKKLILKDGFEMTALNYSTSSSASKKGNIGWVSSKSLSKSIFDILNKMKKGEISKPIKRQNSILFLKINDIRNNNLNQQNISDLKNKIINKKKNELFDLYSKSHLSKIRNNSLIEFK